MANSTYIINGESHVPTPTSKASSRCCDSMIRDRTFFNNWWDKESSDSFLELETGCRNVDWAARKWLSVLRKNDVLLNDEQEPIDSMLSPQQTARRLSFSDSSDDEDRTFVDINRNEEKTSPIRMRPSIYNVFPARKRINFFGSPRLEPSNIENVACLKDGSDSVSVHNELNNESNSEVTQNQTFYEFKDTLDAVNYFIERGNKMMIANSPTKKFK